MVTAKNLIKNSKAELGWDTKDADYTSWRNAVKEYCAQHAIRSWGGASEAGKNALIAAATRMTGFRPAIRARLASGSEFHHKALEALRQDCLKKKSETVKDLAMKTAMKRPRLVDDDDDGDDDESDVVQEVGNPVAIWLADPAIVAHRDANNDWIWDVRARRKLWVIHVRTLDGICDVVKTYMPAGRNIREIFGALENRTPAAPTIPADWYSLKSDAEVLAFLQKTNSKPIWLLVLLHPDAAGPPNTPPPDPLDPYFPMDKFEPPLEYDDHPEDSDALVRNIAGVEIGRAHV